MYILISIGNFTSLCLKFVKIVMMKCPSKVTLVAGLHPTVVFMAKECLFLIRFVHSQFLPITTNTQLPTTIPSTQRATINHLVDRLPRASASDNAGAAHPMSLHCAECNGGRSKFLSWLAELGTPGRKQDFGKQ